MKNVFKLGIMLGLLAVGLTACSDDDDDHSARYRSYGMILDENDSGADGYNIITDRGSVLIPDADRLPNVTVKNNDRVIAYYSILNNKKPVEGEDQTYGVWLTHLYKVLSKQPVLLSFVNENEEHREDSIGNNPIRINDTWFGGKYLNIDYSIARHRNSTVQHMLNLVADDIDFDDDGYGYMRVFLRHNGYDDVPTIGTADSFVYSRGLVSFDLTSLLPEGRNSLNIILYWRSYTDGFGSPREFSDRGTFTPYGSDKAPSTDNTSIYFENVK